MRYNTPLCYAGDSICLNTPADDGLLLLSSLVLPVELCVYSRLLCVRLSAEWYDIVESREALRGTLQTHLRVIRRADLSFLNGFLFPFFPRALISDRSEPVASSLEAIPPARKVHSAARKSRVSQGSARRIDPIVRECLSRVTGVISSQPLCVRMREIRFQLADDKLKQAFWTENP